MLEEKGPWPEKLLFYHHLWTVWSSVLGVNSVLSARYPNLRPVQTGFRGPEAMLLLKNHNVIISVAFLRSIALHIPHLVHP